MVEIAVFVALVGGYFWVEGSETSLKEALIAMAIYALYLVVYLLVEPFPALSSKYMGQLYGLLPALSFAAILFPHFNTRSPDVVTKALGWLGLATAFVILSYFKWLVW